MAEQPDNEGQTAIETFYDRWAKLYDGVAMAPGVGAWRERAVETLDLSGGETVVDVGCGTGANFTYLRDAVGPEGRVVGIDLSAGMISRARYWIDRRGWENVHAIRGDATQLPVDDVDAVLSTFVVGMFAEPQPVVREWIRAIEPGGRVTLLNAERSDRLALKPVNLGFRAFVRLSAPGNRLRLRSPTHQLEQRWRDACDGLFAGTTDHIEERLGGGFVVLASGRVPADK